MKILLYLTLILCSSLCLACSEGSPETTAEQMLNNTHTAYIGTYTRSEGHVDGKAEGIYRVEMDHSTGKITAQQTVAEIINPSFLSLSKDQSHLYAVSELAREDEPTGFLYHYKIVADSLQLVDRFPTDGQAPCHLGQDQSGQYIFVTNYFGGKLKVFKLGEDDKLKDIQRIQLEGSSVHPQQTAPLLHSTQASPDNQYIAVADKGSDKIWLFTIDEKQEQLVAHTQPFVAVQAGAGPRHMAWSADGQFLYVINELDNTIAVIQYERVDQRFSLVQVISTLPEDYAASSYCADLHLHPNGKFLYGSNRGHNSIAIFSVDAENGQLTSLGFESTRGEYPRNFSISPNNKLLLVANQNTSNITSYQIGVDGKLTYLDLDYEIGTPVCIEYVDK